MTLPLLMPPYYGTDWIAAAFALLGTYLLGSKSKFGFIFNVFACAFSIVFAYLAGTLPIGLVNGLMLGLNVRGYLNWVKSQKDKGNSEEVAPQKNSLKPIETPETTTI